MKTSIDDLPERKQRELGRVIDILREEFEDALTNSNWGSILILHAV